MSQKSFYNDIIFSIKSNLLKLNRICKNTFSPIKKLPALDTHQKNKILAESISSLWFSTDSDDYPKELESILTAGKVQNLRVAAKALNNLQIKKGQCFSFWNQLGRLTQSKGYVEGRELREGCLIPSIGGGICQLSNALYDIALKCEFAIKERHAHTKVIKGSLAETGRDATVYWNYLDLKFVATFDCVLTVELDEHSLIVKVLIDEHDKKINHISCTVPDITVLTSDKINDCHSCQNTDCYKEQFQGNSNQGNVYLLDKYWPEYNQYVNEQIKNNDTVLLPIYQARRGFSQFRWKFQTQAKILDFPLQTIYHSLSARVLDVLSANIQKLFFNQQKRLARSYAKKIPPSARHLIIDSALLIPLDNLGVLAGRTYDVLVTREPVKNIQTRLDQAVLSNYTSQQLNDFRISDDLCDNEMQLFHNANKLITPHQLVAKQFNNNSVILNWEDNSLISTTKNNRVDNNKFTILFAGACLDRKGFNEFKDAVKDMDIDVILKSQHHHFNDHRCSALEFTTKWPNTVDLVVLPAYIEQQPRMVITAINNNIPVLVSTFCGLALQKNVHLLNKIDSQTIKIQISKFMA